MSDVPQTYSKLSSTVGGDAQAVIDTAQQAVDPVMLNTDDHFGVAVPAGADFEVLDLEHLLDKPRRKKGTYSPATVESLCEYVKDHKDDAATSVWVHPTSGKVTALLNDSSKTEPGWRDHKAVLELIKTDEWNHWAGPMDGQLGSQQTFAEHLEDGAAEIQVPDAATLLEIAQSFHATTNVTFRSAQRLHDGEIKLTYDEETDARAGRGENLGIPQTFELAIAPFVGEDPYKVTARLRYRLKEGNLTIGYKLDRPEYVIRDALDRIAERIESELPNVYKGSPPA